MSPAITTKGRADKHIESLKELYGNIVKNFNDSFFDKFIASCKGKDSEILWDKFKKASITKLDSIPFKDRSLKKWWNRVSAELKCLFDVDNYGISNSQTDGKISEKLDELIFKIDPTIGVSSTSSLRSEYFKGELEKLEFEVNIAKARLKEWVTCMQEAYKLDPASCYA